MAIGIHTHEQALQWPPGCHPLDQAYLWSPVPLYQWQRDVLVAAARPHSRVALSTANESGKTSILAPIFLLSVMAAFPGARCFAQSGSEQQVKEQLFEEHIVPLVEPLKDKGWRLWRGDTMKVQAPNGSTLLCYVCKDPNKVEGFHGHWNKHTGMYQPCAYLSDESKGIVDPINEAVRRIDPDFWIAMSTPGKMTGWFYEAIDPDQLDESINDRRARMIRAA